MKETAPAEICNEKIQQKILWQCTSNQKEKQRRTPKRPAPGLRCKKDTHYKRERFDLKKRKSPNANCVQTQSGAADRNRTGTVLPPRDFKSLASASSATAANNGFYYSIASHEKQRFSFVCRRICGNARNPVKRWGHAVSRALMRICPSFSIIFISQRPGMRPATGGFPQRNRPGRWAFPKEREACAGGDG